jgi:hypothetical protein
MPTALTLALVSNDVYDDTGSAAILGYRRLAGTAQLRWSGSDGSSFFGAAYYANGVGIVAYRGSQERKDWTDADVSIGMGDMPIDQLGDAFDFFSTAASRLKSAGASRIVVTGHSLGGGLTQVVAARVTSFPVRGVSFNAPGMASLAGPISIQSGNSQNVWNIRSATDPVSMKGKHIGRGPYVVRNGGYHGLGPLIEAMVQDPLGSIRF